MTVKIILTISLLSFSLCVYAQKKPLDHSVYDGWQSLSNLTLSEDGHWISYSIDPQVGDNLLVIENPEKGKKIVIPRGTKAAFTEGSGFLVCTIKPPQQLTETTKEKAQDTLAILNLKTTEIWKRGGIQSFFLDSENWITFRTSERPENLFVRNLVFGEEFEFDKVQSYKFIGPTNRLLLLQKANQKGKQSFISVKNFSKKNLDTLISEQGKIRDFTLSYREDRIAYLIEDNQSLQIKEYSFISKEIEEILSNSDLPDSLQLNSERKPYYGNNDEHLYFGVKRRPRNNANTDISPLSTVVISRFNDNNYHSTQSKSKPFGSDWDFLTVYNFSSSIHFILEHGIIRIPKVKNEKIILAKTNFSLTPESQWVGGFIRNYDLYEIKPHDGKSRVVEKSISSCSGADAIQLLDKYFVWYDCAKKNYFAWNGESIRNITEKIPVPLYKVDWDMPGNPSPYGLMGWVAKDSTILIYDQFDIWKADIKGKKQPVNLTQGEGRKQNTEIRYAFRKPGIIDVEIDPNKNTLLKTFNFRDRSSGLSILTPDFKNFIKLQVPGSGFYIDIVSQANDKLIYTKENYKNSPDLYYARVDYKKGTLTEKKITSLNPQQSEYSWGTSELYHWTTFNGHKGEGILYKPENFDPNKKYPLICHYYEALGVPNELNKYIPPSPSRGSINISYFLSQGYVVFVPGISYSLGETCLSVYDFVVSGTESLIKEGFIDKENMGIQGSSFGGYETLCLITQTKIYKAAWASVPVGNLITFYGLSFGSGSTNHGRIENGQFRMNAMVWDDVDRYIKNSPYFHLKKVNTPTVIVSNDNDENTRIEYGIEMFWGMRRLGKKAWLLNYSGENHAVIKRSNQLDLQKRMVSFFDYYLRNAAQPLWMTNDIK